MLETLAAVASDADKPAGGAPAGQIAVVTAFVALVWGPLFWMGSLHRRGRATPIGLVASQAARLTGLPAWAVAPLLLAAGSLVSLFVGLMWDVSLHIDNGRDEGPLANLSHYLLVLGLTGLFAAGFLAMVLPRPGETPGPASLRITDSWRAPIGGAMVAAAGGVAFLGFPLDDFWHRLFGQDVTLWSPTHLMMVGGGVLSLVGMAVLYAEGVRAGWRELPLLSEARPLLRRVPGAERVLEATRAESLLRWAHTRGVVDWAIRALIMGALLIALSMFLLEFDYGIPQFPLVFQPLIVAAIAGIALVAARLWAGPGAALVAALIYVGGRALATLLVGPVLGEVTSAFPLFLAEAACVELAALALLRRGSLAFGAAAGLLAGTVGFAAEWPWTQAVMPHEWTEALLPEGLVVAVAGGVAGGLVGALLGSGLRGDLPRLPVARAVALGSLVLFAGLVANGLVHSEPSSARATVTLQEVRPAPEREVLATVRFEPRDLADGATWVRGIAWQGGDPLVGFQMRRVGEGVYRATEPLPVHGSWKTGIRVLNGRTMLGVPVYEPEDRGIPAAEVPALPRFTRAMAFDRELLQRERKADVPGWLWTAGSLLVLAIFLAFASFLAWAVWRFARMPAHPPALPPRGERERGPLPTEALGVPS